MIISANIQGQLNELHHPKCALQLATNVNMQLIPLKIFEACDRIKKLNISLIIPLFFTVIVQILCVIWHTQASLLPRNGASSWCKYSLTPTNQCFFLHITWPEV